MNDETQRSAAQPERPVDTTAPTGSSEATSRRTFLRKSATKAAYVAPLVLLSRPRSAIAGSGGSDITNP